MLDAILVIKGCCLLHFISPNIQQTVGAYISPIKYAIVIAAVLRSHWRNQRCWQNICMIGDAYNKVKDK